MTLVKMLQTRKGSEDGFVVKQFYAGQTYDIAESLARLFFADGYATRGDLKRLDNIASAIETCAKGVKTTPPLAGELETR